MTLSVGEEGRLLFHLSTGKFHQLHDERTDSIILVHLTKPHNTSVVYALGEHILFGGFVNQRVVEADWVAHMLTL